MTDEEFLEKARQAREARETREALDKGDPNGGFLWVKCDEGCCWNLIMGHSKVAFEDTANDTLNVNPYLPERPEPNRNRVADFLD